MIPLEADIAIREGWDTIWSTISGSWITTAIRVLGGLIVAFLIARWLWQRRKTSQGGGGRKGAELIGLLLAVAVLGFPNQVIGIVLSAIQSVIGMILQLVDSFGIG